MIHFANTLVLNSAQFLACLILTLGATACVAQETVLQKNSDSTDAKEQRKPSMLTLPGFGMEIPILTSRDDLDRYVGHVVAIRGSIGNRKIPHIIGVEVTGGHKLPDACAIGMLAKFVTTEKDWEERKRLNPHKIAAGSFGPGTRYKLYSSMTGDGSEAQAWGTGATKDPSRIKAPDEKKNAE